MLKCGGCGSGITAQEKFKRHKDGSIKRYIYYHCTKFNDFHCPEPYIREEELVEQLSKLLKYVSTTEILLRPILKPELDKFMLIQQRYQNQNIDNGQIGTEVEIEQGFDLTKFIEYIFKEGTKEQKRELIGCLNTTIYLENRVVTTREQIKGTEFV